MKVKVKICGIKTLAAAQIAIGAGADFLGFNFVPTSKRFIKPEKAKQIINRLKQHVGIVGVFMDEDIARVNELINELKLDYVQLHGDESPEYLGLIRGAKSIKTFSLSFEFDTEKTKQKMKNYNADYFLLDREEQGIGELLNTVKVRQLTSIFPVILAGGLTVENVTNAVQSAKPQVVDVAGGVETDGVKDEEKIIKFVRNAKNYDF